MAVASVGIAAHISAAAEGGPRYDASMTPEERSSIGNAIWLCANHAMLIDRDTTTYTRDVITEWKRIHEQRMAEELANARAMADARRSSPPLDLVALGPRVVALGELVGAQASRWTLRLFHFVVGDTAEVTAFGERLSSAPAMDSFVLLNSEGDGRVVSSAPAWRRKDGAIELELDVEPRYPRTRADELGADLEIVDGDLSPSFSRVAGLKRLPQHLEVVMGMLKDAEWSGSAFGSRVSEYFALYGGTPWFARLVKLEAIRLAAIPYLDPLFKRESTQFRCIERVLDIELLSPSPNNKKRLPVRMTLDVAGVGTWQRDLALYVVDYPPPPNPRPSMTDTGPFGGAGPPQRPGK